MARVSAAEAAEKLVRRLQSSTQDITRGVDRVQVAPGIAAAEQQDRMLQSLIEAITSGRWAAAVSAVSLGEWKNAMKDKGIPRIATGVAAAQPKIQAFFTKLLPQLDSIKAETDAMPQNTIDERIARSAHFQRRMHDLKGTFK